MSQKGSDDNAEHSKYSKTCLKRNLTGPEHFSAKASFRLIEVHCLKRNLKGPEHFSAKASLNWTEKK
jgi:hypothetical protein